MSGAKEVAKNAERDINSLIADMLEGDHSNNEISLGRVLCGNTEIQVQLKVTTVRNDFLDDDEEDFDSELEFPTIKEK